MTGPECSVRAVAYAPERRREWDAFVTSAKNGHFFFLRDYMEYHADRFPDASAMFYDERDRLIGLLPATVRNGALSSHAGLSFGGVISDRRMKVALMLELFAQMYQHYRQLGFRELVYKAIPRLYHQLPAEEDLYALFRFGARLIRRDVSSTIDRRVRLPLSKGRETMLKSAGKRHLVVEPSSDFASFMAIEEDLLRTRYNARPTHTAAELDLLARRFPENIRLFAANRDGAMLAGVVVYETERVAHTQYIGSGEEGRKLGALDVILQHLIHERYEARDYFDFGISSEQDGRKLNTGLIMNKESYGARATVFDWYLLDLSGTPERAADQAG